LITPPIGSDILPPQVEIVDKTKQALRIWFLCLPEVCCSFMSIPNVDFKDYHKILGSSAGLIYSVQDYFVRNKHYMKLSNIANVLDIEHDNGLLIEIGLTTVDLSHKKILQTYSLPIKTDFEISPAMAELTGWTSIKLLKQGIDKDEACRRLSVYGCTNRLLVTDHSNEIPFLERSLSSQLSPHRLNVSILFALLTGEDINLGLEAMLEKCRLKFEGKLHSAADDSKNIARLFLKLLPHSLI
jgi:DNA polymerase III alpha subunit (gram-positive type)